MGRTLARKADADASASGDAGTLRAPRPGPARQAASLDPLVSALSRAVDRQALDTPSVARSGTTD